jgi:hypothetical protein
MGIMDIQNLNPLASALTSLLKQDGRLAIQRSRDTIAYVLTLSISRSFIATVLHPLFFTSGAKRQITVHEDPATGQRKIDRTIVLSEYRKVAPARQLLFSDDVDHKPPVCTINR